MAQTFLWAIVDKRAGEGLAEAQPWESLFHGCRAHKKANNMQAALLRQPSLHPW